MIGFEDAWRRVAAALSPLPATSCALRESLGLVLAEDIVATENMPPFPASAMDGYAVIADDTSDERMVLGEQSAGLTKGLRVTPGTATRIMTGAELPAGADAVMPVEDTREQNGRVRVLARVVKGAYVRPVGQDIHSSDLVLRQGSVLGPAEIGLLAIIGRSHIQVYRRPSVALMATGDELVPLDHVPAQGQIRDSNSHALVAAVESAGCKAVSLGIVRDDPETLRKAILDGVACADMVLTSGGVSMGTRDLIKPLLEELGTVHFGRVALKPGKPLTFACVRGVPFFGLPGFPVSTLVMFEMFVRPALRLMAGHSALWRPEVRARVRHALRHTPDRTELQRAVLAWRDGVCWAETTGDQVSGRLSSLVGANALLVIPEGQADVQAGDEVRAILIQQPESVEATR